MPASLIALCNPRHSAVAALVLSVALAVITALFVPQWLWAVGVAFLAAAVLARGSATGVRLCVGAVGITAAVLGGVLMGDLLFGSPSWALLGS